MDTHLRSCGTIGYPLEPVGTHVNSNVVQGLLLVALLMKLWLCVCSLRYQWARLASPTYVNGIVLQGDLALADRLVRVMFARGVVFVFGLVLKVRT